MAKYNYWAAGGKPTQFLAPSFLPSATTHGVKLELGREYIAKIIARSPTGATLRVTSWDNTEEGVHMFPLTSEFKEYTATWKETDGGNVYIRDVNSAGNIEVLDIQVYEKPLGKATINIIDGFISGYSKWNFHANSKIIDDSTLELNATGDNANIITVSVVPSTEYTLSVDKEGSGGYVGGLIGNGGTQYLWIDDTVRHRTFTTGPTQTILAIHVKRTTTGKTVFRNVMLNLGPLVPYEKKRGERMVPPHPGKNLFNKEAVTLDKYIMSLTTGALVSTSTWNVSDKMPATVGESYVISGRNGYMGSNPGTAFYTSADVYISGGQALSYVAPPNAAYMRTTVHKDDMETFQIERGTTATSYSPFRVGTTKRVTGIRKATKYPAGKNLFSGWVPGYITVGVWNENPTAPDIGQRTSLWMPCKPNQPYTVSGGDRNTWHFKNAAGAITGSASITNPTTPADAAFMRVYYSTNGSHQNIQVEEGLSVTAYEPTRLALRPAPKGLEFNGTADRLTVTTPLATLGNKDFTIESEFKFNPLNPGGYTQQSIVSCGDIRFGISNISIKQLGFYTPTTGWVAVAHPDLLESNRVNLKAVVTPSNVQISINGALVAEKAYTGTINATPQTMLHIGSYAGTQYHFSGALRSLKMVSEGVPILDYDFTKPQNNLGTKIKGNNGLEATVVGSPYQLNRQARR